MILGELDDSPGPGGVGLILLILVIINSIKRNKIK